MPSSEMSRRAGLCLACALTMLAGCGEADTPDDELAPASGHVSPRIVSAEQALDGAHVPTLDPSRMNGAEIVKAIGEGLRCEFRYTSSSGPVLAVRVLPDGVGEGVVKLNGQLVVLGTGPADGALRLTAGDILMTLEPAPASDFAGGDRMEATATFQVGDRLHAGYRGYTSCSE